jgi:hypothetical protein
MAKPDKPGSDDSRARDAQDRVVTALARRALARKHGALPPASDIDDESLLRYVDGALSSDERESLEQKLVNDRDATERLAILIGGLDEARMPRTAHAPATGVLERTVQAVTRHVFHVGNGLLELLRGDGATVLVPAATRGTVDLTRPSAFQIDRLFHTAQGPVSARFELHAERADSTARSDDTQTALVDLVVHVDAQGQSPEGIRCKLLRDGRPVDSREVEAVGCTFMRLGPARYDLELRKGGVEIGRVLFDLRG